MRQILKGPTASRRSALRSRSRTARRFLSVEYLEPRCLLAADFLTPHLGGTLPDLGDDLVLDHHDAPPSQIAPEFEESTSEPLAVLLILSGPANSQDGWVAVGDALQLQIQLDRNEGLASLLSVTTRLFVGYDPEVVEPRGMVVHGDDGSCHPFLFDGSLNVDLTQCLAATSFSDSMVLELSFEAVGAGTAAFAVSVEQANTLGDPGSTQILYSGSSEIDSRADRTVDMQPEVPRSVPTDAANGLWASSRDRASGRSAGLLETRSLTPKTSVPGTVSRAFTISLGRPDASLPLLAESTITISIRARVTRSTWTWSLSEDATANLLRPLALTQYEDLAENPRDPSLLLTHREHDPAQTNDHSRPPSVQSDRVRAEMDAFHARELYFGEADRATPTTPGGSFQFVTPQQADLLFAAWHAAALPRLEGQEPSEQ